MIQIFPRQYRHFWRNSCVRNPILPKPYRGYTTLKDTQPSKNHGLGIYKFVKLGMALGGLSAGSFFLYKITTDRPFRRKFVITLGGLVRFSRTAICGATISLDYTYSLFGYTDSDDQAYKLALSQCNQRCAKRILATCLANGGLYIKMGQGLASFNHILPDEYTTILSALQDQALHRDFETVQEVFQEDFGSSLDAFFPQFNPIPIAAASLAQVFRARTHDGDLVAVKVQYSDLQDRFDGDMLTMKLLLDAIAILYPKFGFSWVLKDVRDTLVRELDFRSEGLNSERCFRELGNIPGIKVPKVYWNLSGRRVLTTQFVEGCKVNDVQAIKHMGVSVKDVAAKMITVFGQQLFLRGFVHADPHPGNILVSKGSDGKALLWLLDHGLYEEVDDSVRTAFAGFWQAVVMRDEVTMKETAHKLGVSNHLLLAGMVLQRPYESASIGFGGHLTKEDVQLMQRIAKEKMDEIIAVLKKLPPPLLLIMRNINLVRSINKELGAPVNRFVLMAKQAIRGLKESRLEETSTHLKKMDSWRSTLIFDLQLAMVAFKMWVDRCLLTVGVFLGLYPEKILSPELIVDLSA